MTKKGVVWIVVYGLLNLAVYLLTLNSIYSLISVSLSTMLIGIIVKFYPKHIGIKFKDRISFYYYDRCKSELSVAGPNAPCLTNVKDAKPFLD